MSATPLDDVRACVFDAYGTLFDFASAAAACADTLGPRGPALTALWRDKQLQYSWLRGLQGLYAPFWQVTGEALDHALDAMDLAGTAGLRDRLMGLYLKLAPFPEVPALLAALRARGQRTAILSNGSPDMLGAVVENAGFTAMFDAVLSVDAVRTYKTDPRVYRLVEERLGLPAARIAFLSSNAWDAHAAAAFGMQVVWCNRQGQRPERLPGVIAREVRDLSELPALLG